MIVRRLTEAELEALASVERYAVEPAITSATAFIAIGLEVDEPVLELRARDAAALPMLNLYATMTEGLFDDERALGIEAKRVEFVDWRRGPGAETLRDPD